MKYASSCLFHLIAEFFEHRHQFVGQSVLLVDYLQTLCLNASVLHSTSVYLFDSSKYAGGDGNKKDRAKNLLLWGGNMSKIPLGVNHEGKFGKFRGRLAYLQARVQGFEVCVFEKLHGATVFGDLRQTWKTRAMRNTAATSWR